MPKDKEWLAMWEKKALIEDEYLSVGRDRTQDAKIICEDIKQKLSLGKDDFLLDIGCGTGLFDYLLSPSAKTIIGYETSFNMAKRAGSRRQKNVKILQGETNILPFKDKIFAKVLCYSSAFNYSFKNYKEVEEYLLEIKRVCKPEAVVLIGELHDVSEKWRVAPGRLRRILRLFRRVREKGVRALLIKLSRRGGRNYPAKNRGEGGIYYQQKWLYNSLWYSRNRMLRILAKLNLKGEIKERGQFLPYHEREFDVLFRV